jgi:hypothetical protein
MKNVALNGGYRMNKSGAPQRAPFEPAKIEGRHSASDSHVVVENVGISAVNGDRVGQFMSPQHLRDVYQ